MRSIEPGIPRSRYAIAQLRCSACTPSRNGELDTDRLIQVVPLRILLFDQFHLPIALPFLKFFFAGNGGYRIIVDFEPNKPCDIVPGSEAGDGLYSVLVDPAHNVVSHAYVNLSILPARQDVDVVGHDSGGSQSRDSGSGPSDHPGMTNNYNLHDGKSSKENSSPGRRRAHQGAGQGRAQAAGA